MENYFHRELNDAWVECGMNVMLIHVALNQLCRKLNKHWCKLQRGTFSSKELDTTVLPMLLKLAHLHEQYKRNQYASPLMINLCEGIMTKTVKRARRFRYERIDWCYANSQKMRRIKALVLGHSFLWKNHLLSVMRRPVYKDPPIKREPGA